MYIITLLHVLLTACVRDLQVLSHCGDGLVVPLKGVRPAPELSRELVTVPLYTKHSATCTCIYIHVYTYTLS